MTEARTSMLHREPHIRSQDGANVDATNVRDVHARTPKGRRALEDQREMGIPLPQPSAPPLGAFGHRGPGSQPTSTLRLAIDSPESTRSQSMPPLDLTERPVQTRGPAPAAMFKEPNAATGMARLNLLERYVQKQQQTLRLSWKIRSAC